MNISAAMTSKHVMHLERHLGARLLNRSSRHLSLTEIGKVYFEQCRDVLDILEQPEAAVSHTAVVPCGVLKISAPVWCANRLFTKAQADYRATYPEVTLDFDLSGRLVNLVEEGFDLALRASRTLGDNLIARPITPFRFQLLGAPAYLASAGRPERLMSDYAWFSGQLYAVYTSRRYLLPKVRTFVDFIAEEGRLG